MTLLELKEQMQSIHPGGRMMQVNSALLVQQRRAFSKLFEWCEPLNLLIAYDDRDIAKIVDSVWRIKKPLTGVEDSSYIDIDERLELSFVYMMISLLITGNGKESKLDKAEFEAMAYKEALEYQVGVLSVGYDNAKRVYEQESYITGVSFDCLGRVYEVSSRFVDLVIDCILCGKQCMNASESSQLELYKKYIAGEVRPVDKEKLLAVDKAVFKRIINDEDRMMAYDSDKLNEVSTLFCEYGKLLDGESVSDWVKIEDKRMGFYECDKPICADTNNRCKRWQ